MENYLDCVIGEFKKFSPNGEPLPFPGNTFLCHLPKGDVWRFAHYVQTQTEISSFAHKFALLPPSSFHMTVYEGVCDDVRRKENWVDILELDTPLYGVTEYFCSRLHEMPKTNTIRMKIVGYVLKGGIMFHLEPADESTKKYLYEFRCFMKDKIKMNNINAEGYQFHISLAYNLISLTSEEEKEFEIISDRIANLIKDGDYIIEFDAVEFCYFNDMFSFATLSKLKI